MARALAEFAGSLARASTWRIALRGLGRQPRRSGIVLAAVAIGLGGLLLAMALQYGLVVQMAETAIRSEIGDLQAHAAAWREIVPCFAVRPSRATQGQEGAMAFIQVIEFTTTNADEVQKLADEYRDTTADRRTVVRASLCRDRDQADRYVNIVEFESYEAAMENSNLPETQEFARRMAELCDGPPRFLNLDVVDSFEG